MPGARLLNDDAFITAQHMPSTFMTEDRAELSEQQALYSQLWIRLQAMLQP